MALEDEDKRVWRRWASWDKKRHEREMVIYEEKRALKSKSGEEVPPPKTNGNRDDSLHVPKKRKSQDSEECLTAIPKKKKSA